MKKSVSVAGLKHFLLIFPVILLSLLAPLQPASANPIAPPPHLLEIYFGSEGWSIEMKIWEYDEIYNLDGLRLSSLEGSSLFLPREVAPDDILILTQDDLESPLDINQAGDALYIEFQFGDTWWPLDYYGLLFGDIPAQYPCEVCAPEGEESIAWQKFDYYDPYYPETYYWIAKELPNTLGYNPFDVQLKVPFSGYVYDRNDQPLPGVEVRYCLPMYYASTVPTVPQLITDENGYFYTDTMYCKIYSVNFICNGGSIGDTVICLEPQSENYFEFKLDTLLTGLSEPGLYSSGITIRSIPNPASTSIIFTVESDILHLNKKGIIKIYSQEGFIVDIVPVTINNPRQEVSYALKDKPLAAGSYFYNLEINRQKMASGKMIVGR